MDHMGAKNGEQVLKLGELMNPPRGRLAPIKRNNLRPSVRGLGARFGRNWLGTEAFSGTGQFLTRKLFSDARDQIWISGARRMNGYHKTAGHLVLGGL